MFQVRVYIYSSLCIAQGLTICNQQGPAALLPSSPNFIDSARTLKHLRTARHNLCGQLPDSPAAQRRSLNRVAPTASLNGMRRSEKAKVLEKDLRLGRRASCRQLLGPYGCPRYREIPDSKVQSPNTSYTTSRGLGWRFLCSVEVNKLSSNKQLSLSFRVL